jgi:hypothetical protein
MKKMISICGLVCAECGAFLATQNNDDEARKKVAEEWSKAYTVALKPEDIYCEGCLTTSGRVFNYTQVCEIRACGHKKKVKNCAYCQEYPCEKLSKFFDLAPQAKKNLEEDRKSS